MSGQSSDGRGPEIRSVHVEPAQRWNQAEIAFLNVSYGRGAGGLPTRLFVKLRRDPDPLADVFPGEQRFYQETRNADLPIARCFAALADAASGATCILLEDLRDTHVAEEWPLPPSLTRCEQALAALAKVHARGRRRAAPELEARETQLCRRAACLLPSFMDRLGDRLPKDRAHRLSAVFERILDLKTAYYRSDRPVTRVHGDAHFWNALYPKSPANDEALLIDWEDWRVDSAGVDLALLMAMHWCPDRRRRHEQDLLRQYLSRLNDLSERPTTWDALWLEYRLGHVCNAIVPVFQHAAGAPHASWWSHLERWFLAFEDMRCEELL